MANIAVSGPMQVKTLKSQFKTAFGSTLRVYNGVGFADPSATLASIRSGNTKGGSMKINGNLQVANFESKFKDAFGIKVRVANSTNTALASPTMTLSEAGRQK